jgi:hypothetical protein
MKYETHLNMACNPDWLERLHLLAGGKRKRAGYIRDVIDLLWIDKPLRDTVNQKRMVKNERS